MNRLFEKRQCHIRFWSKVYFGLHKKNNYNNKFVIVQATTSSGYSFDAQVYRLLTFRMMVWFNDSKFN